MIWEKKGLVFQAGSEVEWRNNSALQPTPLLMGDVIRVYVGFRDRKGVSRPGYVDLDASNPSKIIGISPNPLLELGEAGCFDDNGMVPCAVFREENKVYMMYAGYNIGYHVRMTIFSGLAVSEDGGNTFVRCRKIPIMDRTENERLFRVVHTALKEDDGWKIYYGAGNCFLQGAKKTLPVYEIMYMQTDSPFKLQSEGKKVVSNKGSEHRVGRPYVVKRKGKYQMFFGGGIEEIPYTLAYAESPDGVHWIRDDKKLGLELSATGWDSQMMAYPALVDYKDKTYLFYNGNEYGKYGFGYAELLSEE